MNMIITHKAAVAEFGSPYRINKEIKANRLFRVARGFYSDTRYVDPYVLCAMRYPGAIVTMDSAFYLHGLTDRVPDKVHLATARGATRITDAGVVQRFSEDRLLNPGKTVIERDGAKIQVYGRERMLIELMRASASMAPDYYAELIGAYRRIVDELDLYAVEEYMEMFERSGYMADILQREVL